ncbi:sensor domain-containing phosphodiesterase [Neptuniibacter halophilus]|uniref:sensor domain-containing phosphodiesterase n=1 Tax=Neptuniibacter halophilus TaxID=651666 RepID=UPI00257251DF|nr:sensor domain-containing phosphodiesterase [Neptuniibacter halophilus]
MSLIHSHGFIDYPRRAKLKRIARACAQQLKISRVGIWKLDPDHQRIQCELLYLLDKDQFLRGTELFREDYPAYFKAITEDRIIRVDDARTDPRTSEFTPDYLTPNNIYSMLDAPIFAAGKLQGVICLEQVGEKRTWDMAEMSYVASLADCISMLNEQETWLKDREQLEFLEQCDPLTGLEKRPYFQKRLDFDLQDSPDPDRVRALILTGLDFFASINDDYGHKVADTLLKVVAEELIKRTNPSTCRLSRLGGDNFAIWFPELESRRQLNDLLEKLKQIGEKPLNVAEGAEIKVSFSTGVVVYPMDSVTLGSPMRCAELAMYRAKQEDRGGVKYFSAEWLDQMQIRRSLESELIAALDSDQLVAHYQPIYASESLQVIGLEALVRWAHPEKGCIPPAHFLPLAKKLGLMGRLGHYMLHQACRDIKSIRETHPGVKWVSVNISSEQLYDPALSEEIQCILQEYQLPAESLELEIVEELISQDSALVRSQLESLSDLGIRLAIDDFGTGYSSLSRLKHMPVTKLKIDKSFVDGLPDSEDDRCITQSIMGLAKGLQLELVAEGVETERQAEYLRQAGCEYMQGFLFARPMPLSKLLKQLGT